VSLGPVQVLGAQLPTRGIYGSLACKSYLSTLGAGLEGHGEREDHQLPNRCYSELNLL